MDELNNLAAFLYGRAFASSLVCSIEGDPAPEGGAPAPQTTPPAPATPAAPSFTPDQLAWIEAERTASRNAGAAAARRAVEGRQPARAGEQQAQPSTPPAPPAATQNVDVRAEINRIRAFERAAGGYGLSPDALAVLEDDFNTANPSDPAEWVSKRAKAFGWKSPTNTSNQAPGSTPAAAPAAPQPTPGSAPPSTVVTEDTRLMDMSEADRNAFVARHGVHKFKARFLAEMRADPRRFSLRR